MTSAVLGRDPQTRLGAGSPAPSELQQNNAGVTGPITGVLLESEQIKAGFDRLLEHVSAANQPGQEFNRRFGSSSYQHPLKALYDQSVEPILNALGTMAHYLQQSAAPDCPLDKLIASYVAAGDIRRGVYERAIDMSRSYDAMLMGRLGQENEAALWGLLNRIQNMSDGLSKELTAVGLQITEREAQARRAEANQIRDAAKAVASHGLENIIIRTAERAETLLRDLRNPREALAESNLALAEAQEKAAAAVKEPVGSINQLAKAAVSAVQDPQLDAAFKRRNTVQAIEQELNDTHATKYEQLMHDLVPAFKKLLDAAANPGERRIDMAELKGQAEDLAKLIEKSGLPKVTKFVISEQVASLAVDFENELKTFAQKTEYRQYINVIQARKENAPAKRSQEELISDYERKLGLTPEYQFNGGGPKFPSQEVFNKKFDEITAILGLSVTASHADDGRPAITVHCLGARSLGMFSRSTLRPQITLAIKPATDPAPAGIPSDAWREMMHRKTLKDLVLDLEHQVKTGKDMGSFFKKNGHIDPDSAIAKALYGRVAAVVSSRDVGNALEFSRALQAGL